MNPRTPAEALRAAAQRVYTRSRQFSAEQSRIYEAQESPERFQRAGIMRVAYEEILKELRAEAERLEALEAQSAELTAEELATTLKEMLIAGTDRDGHVFPEYARDYLNDRAITITRRGGI